MGLTREQATCGVHKEEGLTNKTRFLALAAIVSIGALLPATASATTAGPPGTVLFNSQVNATAPPPPAGMVDNFPQNKQNEPGLALDPTNGDLIAGSNDELDEPLCTGAGTAASPGSCPFAPNVGNSGVYVSTGASNGASWTQPSYQESPAGVGSCQGRTIHTLPGYCEQNLESFGDPILSVGPARGSNGKFSWANGSVVYYGNLAFAASGAGVPAMAVSRSNNDAASWKSPVIVSSSSANPVDFNDKDYVWADANQNSRALYVVWANEEGTPPTALIKFTESDNGGATWSAPITVGGIAGFANTFFPWVAASPDGMHVFVGWPGQTWKAPGTAPGPNVVTQLAAYNLRTNGNWSGGHILSTDTGDPDGSSTNSLGAQFLGDYATAVASNTTAWFVWTDTRNETACATVDAFRAGSGPKPNPDTSCPPRPQTRRPPAGRSSDRRAP